MSTFQINRDHQQRVRRFNKELVKKLKLELSLLKDFNTLFNKISSESGILYLSNGSIMNMSKYDDEIRRLLVRHYKLVFKEFPSPVEIDFKNAITNSMIQEKQDEYINDRANQSTQQISDTTQKRWQRAIDSALLLLLLGRDTTDNEDDRESISNVEIRDDFIGNNITQDQFVSGSRVDDQSRDKRDAIVALAVKKFNSGNSAKSRLIANTETQSASESHKHIIAETLLTTAGIVSNVNKMWMTILDGRERASHNAANGQIRPFNSPYIVQDQLLMYPGDISINATADNVINCRCGSMLIIK